MNWQPSNPTMRALLNAFIQEAPEIYAVGGFVRDQLLGKTKDLADLDLCHLLFGDGNCRRFADRVGWAYYPLDEGRDMGRLVFTANVGEPLVCDVARMRGDTIETDLLARDFTINAMAVAYTKNQAPRLIDVVGGEADLKQKLVRRVNMAKSGRRPGAYVAGGAPVSTAWLFHRFGNPPADRTYLRHAQCHQPGATSR